MSSQPTIKEVIKEEVIEISLKDLTGVTPMQTLVERKVQVPHFSDDVPEHLKNAYLLKDWVEHSHKRIRDSLSIQYDSNKVTITEKRTKMSKEVVTYDFNNDIDISNFLLYFDIESIKPEIRLLVGVKIAGGSIIKSLIRGQTYYDTYWDTIAKKPKSHTMKKILEGSAAVIVFVASVLPLFAILV